MWTYKDFALTINPLDNSYDVRIMLENGTGVNSSFISFFSEPTEAQILFFGNFLAEEKNKFEQSLLEEDIIE